MKRDSKDTSNNPINNLQQEEHPAGIPIRIINKSGYELNISVQHIPGACIVNIDVISQGA